MNNYFCHKSTAKLHFDPRKNTQHFEPWWLLAMCDDGIVDFYRWLLKKYGIQSYTNNLWGTHISVIRGEKPKNLKNWGQCNRVVNFNYTNQIRWDNHQHAWLDVHSKDLAELRASLGLSYKERFHLTLGRID